MTARRAVLSRIAAVGLAGVAGCTSGDEGGTDTTTTAATDTATTDTATTDPTTTATATTAAGVVDVAVGPEGRLRFDPETVEVAAGGTVRWTFESAGHNVTTKPGSSEKVRLPEGAEPFGSYEGDQHFAIDPVGSTYEHTFTVPGEYVYVCAPHADQGMVGTVLVTE